MTPFTALLSLALATIVPQSAGSTQGTPPEKHLPPPPLLRQHTYLTSGTMIKLEGFAPQADHVEIQAPALAQPFCADVTQGTFEFNLILERNYVNHVFLTSVAGVDCDAPFRSATTSIIVIQDEEAPTVFIDFPPSGSSVTLDSIDVSGRVGDVLSGSYGLEVLVNGLPAEVDGGVGNNGTFLRQAVPLAPGRNLIEAIASDAVSNTTITSIVVTRVDPPIGSPTIELLSGGGQQGPVLEELPEPLLVRVLRGDGTPFAGKLVTFRATRSNAGLATSPGAEPPPGTLLAQVTTDGFGMAQVWWTLGSDAGSGNNVVEVTSTDVVGTVFASASAQAGPASRIVVNANDHQWAGTNETLLLPLVARVLDGTNPVAGTPVTFRVVSGGGLVNGSAEVTVASSAAGLAQVSFKLGPAPGIQRVEADIAGNTHQPAVFSAEALATSISQPTTFEGQVLDNGRRGIGGARCTLSISGESNPPVFTDTEGRFVLTGIGSGPGELFVDATVATTLGGDPIPAGSFPTLHYENFAVVQHALNGLPLPVLMPRLNPNNARSYSLSNETVLEIEELEGLRMIITPGSMTLSNGNPAPEGTIVSLNQVPFDQIPMPLPDAAVGLFAGTLQPRGARFDPPVRIEIPNMTAMAPGAVANFVSFNHSTGRFEIVGTGSVVEDGSSIVTKPGSGITIAGWHGGAPPPPPMGDVSHVENSPEIAGCTVTVAGQSAVANENGGFLISNVPAWGGVLAVSVSCDGAGLYGISEFFTLSDGEHVVLTQPFLLSPVPLSLTVLPRGFLLLPVGSTVALDVQGAMSDGTTAALQTDAEGTTYLSTNQAIATVSATGVVTGVHPGIAYITVSNQGVSATKRFEVTEVIGTTTVVGFVELEDGSPVAGADVTTFYGDSGLSLGDGSFEILAQVPSEATTMKVQAQALLGGMTFAGSSEFVAIVQGGYTDVGVVLLRPSCFESAPNVEYFAGESPISVSSTDLDGDGDQDLAVANFQPSPFGQGAVSVLLNQGNGTFATPVQYVILGVPWAVTSGDLDADGDQDLAVASASPHLLSVFLNQGNGTFAPAVGYDGSATPKCVTSGDLDGDGDLDLVVGNNGPPTTSVAVFLNQGNGTFPTVVYYSVGSRPISVASADMDGDGDMDLATANSNSSSVSVLLNHGNGTFASHVEYGAGSAPSSVTSGDLDGDGDLDLAVANQSSNSVSVLLNQGDGTFASHVEYGAGSAPSSVTSGDLDGDGDLDLAVANATTYSVSVRLNQGNGTFATPVQHDVGLAPWSVTSVDLDGDGKLDLATANKVSDSVSVLLNTCQ